MKDNHLSITMLGTGNATVTKCYNTCFVLQEKEDYFLVDAGGGNQILRILEEKGICLNRIHDMFVTHSSQWHKSQNICMRFPSLIIFISSDTVSKVSAFGSSS